MPETMLKTVDTDPLPSPQIGDMRMLGFSVVRNALSADQIAQLRAVIGTHFRTSGRTRYGGKIQLRAMHNVKGLAELALTPQIAQVIRHHVGITGPLLTGECDIMMNTTSGWHKDITPDMEMDGTLFDDRDFAVYKVAVYLQDQIDGSPAAFRVRPGSQLRKDGSDLPEKRLETRAGDVVVFDVRMDHAGQPPDRITRALRRLTGMIAPLLGRDADTMLTGIRARLGQGKRDRLALFMTFGPENYWTREYERAGRHRHGSPPPLAENVRQTLCDLQLDMIQPR